VSCILNKFKEINMKINKFKVISIAVCCLVASLWSEGQCMDNQPDILESSTVNRTINMQLSSQSVIDTLDFEAIPSRSINLEDTSTSWASYLISPVKANIQMAYDVVKYAFQSPQKGMIVGLFIAYQVAAVAAQYNCVCEFSGGITDNNYVFTNDQNLTRCMKTCNDKCDLLYVSYSGNTRNYTAWDCVPYGRWK
jgi:hypothetical protein